MAVSNDEHVAVDLRILGLADDGRVPLLANLADQSV
jgi:hypothetical protein